MGGKPTKQKPTDQKCEDCGLWYDGRGFKSHQKGCSGNKEEELEPGYDLNEDGEATNPQDYEEQNTPTQDTLACPGCGNKDNGDTPKIYACTGDLKQAFQDTGQWNPQVDRLITESDAWCSNCGTFMEI